MTPQEIQAALARGMNFDAIMAQHAADIQREQGMDMGLSMARARTDVQNIQNARDEGIDPPQTASPWAGTIGAQGRRLDELNRLLTGAPPRPSAPDLTQLGAQAIAALPDISGQLQARLAQQAMQDMSIGDVALTPSQQVRQDALMAQLRAEPQYQAAFQTQADMPTEAGRFAAAKAAIPQNIPRDILSALRGMPPSALRDESMAAIQNLPNIPPDVPLDPNEFARFAGTQGVVPPSDISDFIRRAVTPSFTDQAAQPIAGITTPSDFSDFEGLAVQPSATMAAGDVGRLARAGQPMAAQPIAGLDPNEAARIARRAAEARLNISAEEQARRDLRAMDAATITGSEIAQEDIGLGSPDLPTRKTVTSAEWGDLEYHGLDQYGQPIWLPKSVEGADAPMGGIWGKMVKGISDYTGIGRPDTEQDFIRRAATAATLRGEGLEFYKLLTDKTNLENDLADLNRRASLTNDPADIAAVTEKEKELNDANDKAQAAVKKIYLEPSMLEDMQAEIKLAEANLADAKAKAKSDPTKENKEAVNDSTQKVNSANKNLNDALSGGGISGGGLRILEGTGQNIQKLTDAKNKADADANANPTPANKAKADEANKNLNNAITTLTTGTYTGTGGLQGLTPAAGAAGAAVTGALGTGLGGAFNEFVDPRSRADIISDIEADPYRGYEQVLAQMSANLPVTALTPQYERYLQRNVLPQMQTAFEAGGAGMAGTPTAGVAGSPFSAFEQFVRGGGGRLTSQGYQDLINEANLALQSQAPTDRQAYLQSLYTSPESQRNLYAQGLRAGASGAVGDVIDRMVNRRFMQQQFQAPTTAFLPTALSPRTAYQTPSAIVGTGVPELDDPFMDYTQTGFGSGFAEGGI